MVVDYSNTVNRFTELDAYPMPNVTEYVENISKYQVFSTYFSSKIQVLNKKNTFPLPQEVKAGFEYLRNKIKTASLATIDPTEPFVVEIDASELSLAAALNQSAWLMALW